MKKTLLASVALLSFYSTAFADDASGPMNTFLDEHVVGWASDPVIVAALHSQNIAHAALTQAGIDAMDLAWRAEVGAASTPTISAVVGNAASEFLRSQVAMSSGGITEVILMDMHGLNAAASGVTSDYWQGDEEKFSQTAALGADARHFSEIERDESTGSYQGQASMAITDPTTGEVIGALTVGVNAEALF